MNPNQKKQAKTLLFGGFLMASLMLSGAPASKAALKGKELEEFLKYRPSDFYMGQHPSKAKVVIIEYGSLTCVHCKQFFLSTLPNIKSRFIDKGDHSISVIGRNFVADGPSMIVEVLLRCNKVTGEKYHKIISNLYQTQEDWAYSVDSYNKIKRIFVAHGYKHDKIEACMNETQLLQEIAKEQREIVAKGGLVGTPTIFINATPVEDLRPASIMSQIELALKK